jgi:hypothetical protein
MFSILFDIENVFSTTTGDASNDHRGKNAEILNYRNHEKRLKI